MSSWVAGAAAGAFVLVAGAREASAQERFNPRLGLVTSGFYYRATLAARVNPIGLFLDARAGYRHRLFNSPTRSILLRNTYVAAGLSVVASPAFVRPGIALEVQPLQILNLQVIYEPVVQWFGTFGHVQSYSDLASANFSDAGLSRARDMPANIQTARGWQLTLQGTLQARIGQNLAIRNTFRAVRASYDASTLPSGRTALYYDPFYDSVAPTDGWVAVNDVDVIAQLSDLGTNIGLRFSSVVPLLGSADNAAVTTTTHRLGPIVTYTFKERRHSWFNAPTVFFLAQWWIQHQWRTGGHADTVTQYLPMIILGFSVRGDM